MNAYDGTMHFYVADPNDPLIRAYEGIFPDLFKPLSDLPADLAPHLRVPEELFNVQTRMYGRYHVQDPAAFYSSDDLWTVPAGTTSDQALPSEAYYVVMRMPGEAEPEFLLLQPMVPDGPAEHDRLGRGPQRRPQLRAGPGLPLPDRHDGLRARRRSRPGSTRTR